jgi:hypothetical protein
MALKIGGDESHSGIDELRQMTPKFEKGAFRNAWPESQLVADPAGMASQNNLS